MSDLHKRIKVWSVYVMAAPAHDGVTYFKVGRTSDIAKRLPQVQTGCPLRIAKVWVITLWTNGSSQCLESSMHRWLKDYHSHGEWFAMRTDDDEHKRSMNDAFSKAVEYASQKCETKWRLMDVDELKEAMSEYHRERSERDARKLRKMGRWSRARMAIHGRSYM